MNTVWLNSKELDLLAVAIGTASEGIMDSMRLILDRINDEIGVSGVRATATQPRRKLAAIMGTQHALELSEDELKELMTLPLESSLRERLENGL